MNQKDTTMMAPQHITPLEPYPELAREIGVKDLFFKREDLHPLQSHKGRSIPYMIDEAIRNGYRRFAISSSGNAGIASALYIKKLTDDAIKNGKSVDLEIDIMIGQKIGEKKRKVLFDIGESSRASAMSQEQNIRISIHERPMQAMIQKTKDQSIYPLRQSTDNTALVGYEALWKEIDQEMASESKKVSAVFIGTSSGTTAQSISKYKWDNIQNKDTGFPEIHIVQTPSCHPIYDAINSERVDDDTEKSLANAIVDMTAHRKPNLVEAINRSGGYAWVAKNSDLDIAKSLVKKHTGLDISPNSALSVAGLMHAVYTGKSAGWNGSVVCMICGE